MTLRERRVVLAGGLIALLAIGARVVPWAVGAAGRARAELEAKSELLAHSAAALASLPALEDSSRAIQAALVALAPALLSGKNENEAAAALLGRLTIAASAHGTTVHSSAVIPSSRPTPPGGRLGAAAPVRVEAVLESDLGGLIGTLSRLEMDTVLLRVAAIRIAALDPHSTPDVPERLRGEVILEGWRLVPRSR